MVGSNKYLKLPHNCYIILTSKCNLRCLHCYGNYGVCYPNRELTGEEWSKIFKELAKNNIFYLNISGGEPTFHPDFEMIIDSLVKNKLYFMLTTNGVCNDSALNAITKAKDYLIGIQISLDGPDWKSHGFLRRDVEGKSRKAIFDQTLYSIRKLIKTGIRISIATCLHKNNILKINDLKEIIIELKPKNWSLSTISLSGRARNNQRIFVSESKFPHRFWIKIKTECRTRNIQVNFIDMPSLLQTKKYGRVYYQCPAAKWFCEIYSDGTITPCPLARVNPLSEIIFDNILNKSINEIWHGDIFNLFRNFQKSGCDGCNIKDKCDRCPPQSVQWFNDPLIPPPYCIENGESLGLNNLSKLKQKLKAALKQNNREY